MTVDFLNAGFNKAPSPITEPRRIIKKWFIEGYCYVMLALTIAGFVMIMLGVKDDLAPSNSPAPKSKNKELEPILIAGIVVICMVPLLAFLWWFDYATDNSISRLLGCLETA